MNTGFLDVGHAEAMRVRGKYLVDAQLRLRQLSPPDPEGCTSGSYSCKLPKRPGVKHLDSGHPKRMNKESSLGQYQGRGGPEWAAIRVKDLE